MSVPAGIDIVLHGAVHCHRRPGRGAGSRTCELVTHSRPAARELLDAHGLAPRRDLGQNFVVDPNTVRRIARLAEVGPGDRVVEIGAGLGSLTLALAETGADGDRGGGRPRSAPGAARGRDDRPGVTVVEGDAMRARLARRCSGHDRWALVANLPYNVATPLVCDLLDDVPADRADAGDGAAGGGRAAGAAPGTPGLRHPVGEGRVLGHGRVVGPVPASRVRPPAQGGVGARRASRVAGPSRRRPTRDRLFELVRTAFGQRRKMLRRSLAGRRGARGVRDGRHRARRPGPRSSTCEEWGRLALAWRAAR